MRRKKWSKIFYVILLLFLLEGYAIISEPMELDATKLLLGKLFGTVTELEGDDIEITKFILASEKIGYLTLFHILYGTYLSEYFQNISVYIFSRARDRKKWFTKKVFELVGLSIAYNFVLVGMLTALTLYQSGRSVEFDFWKTVLFVFCIQTVITILTTLILNLCAIRWNILASFLITYSIICFFIVAAIRAELNSNLTIWNPFCYLGLQTGYSLLPTIIWDGFLCIMISVVGEKWVNHMDISL